MASAVLYDADGREVELDLLTETQAGPTFAGVRNIYSLSYPTSGLSPEKLISILRQADFGDPYLFLEMCEEIEEKDNHYLAVLDKRKGATSGLEMTIKPASSDQRDVDLAHFVEDVLFDEGSELCLRENLFDILDALGKGFSATEIIWDTERRMSVGGGPTNQWWVPVDLLWRDPRWFMFDWVSGREMLVRTLHAVGDTIELKRSLTENRQVPSGAGRRHLAGNWNWNQESAAIGHQPLTEPLLPYKFIKHFGRAKSGLPIRTGLTRCIAWTFLFKMFANKDWATFMERFGMPLRVGKYPPGTTEADKLLLLQAVSNIAVDTAGIIPDTMTVEFESAGGASNSVMDYQAYLRYLEDLESKVVLGSTLGTQMDEKGGSRAAATVHADVEDTIVQTDAMRLENTLNRDLVRPIIDLNFGPMRRYPRLSFGLPDNTDLQKWSEMVAGLAAAGLRIPTRAIYEKTKLPEPAPGEDILTPPLSVGPLDPKTIGREDIAYDSPAPPPAPIVGPGGAPGAQKQLPAKQQRQLPSPTSTAHAKMKHPADSIEAFSTEQASEWAEVMPGLTNPLIRACREATSYDDLKKRLNSAARSQNVTKLQRQAAHAFFAAMLAGAATSPAMASR